MKMKISKAFKNIEDEMKISDKTVDQFIDATETAKKEGSLSPDEQKQYDKDFPKRKMFIRKKRK